MTTQEQAYINGFVKRAAEHGYSDVQAIELLKESGLGDMVDGAKNWVKSKRSPAPELSENDMARKAIDDKIEKLKARRYTVMNPLVNSVAPSLSIYNDAVMDLGKDKDMNAPSRLAHGSLGTAAGMALDNLLRRKFKTKIPFLTVAGGAAGGMVHNDKLKGLISDLENERAAIK